MSAIAEQLLCLEVLRKACEVEKALLLYPPSLIASPPREGFLKPLGKSPRL